MVIVLYLINLEIQLWQWAVLFVSILLSPLILSFSIMTYVLGKVKPTILQKPGAIPLIISGTFLGLNQLLWVFYTLSGLVLVSYVSGISGSISIVFLIYGLLLILKKQNK